MTTSSCKERREIDSHFEGTLAPAAEHTMRAHLPTCSPCRAYYRRRLLLAQLDPQALPAEERLGRGLGLAARPPRNRRNALLWPAVAASIVAAAAAVLFVVQRSPTDDGFAARGGVTPQSSSPALHVYRVTETTEPAPVVDTVHPQDELAFAYENAEKKPYLMVFATDELANVYWFYPAWTEPSEDPQAIGANPAPGVHALPEAIKHRYAGSRLQVHTLLLDRPMSVREVERALAAGPLAIPGAIDHVRRLEVRP